MYKIRIQLKSFSAAHRLLNYHADKCSNLHGHNYDISVTLGAKQLNKFGFVMDFRQVKELCNDWVDKYWDHAVILNKDDVTLLPTNYESTFDEVTFLLDDFNDVEIVKTAVTVEE